MNDVRNQLVTVIQSGEDPRNLSSVSKSRAITLACKRRRFVSRAKSPYFGGHSKYPGKRYAKRQWHQKAMQISSLATRFLPCLDKVCFQRFTKGKCCVMPAARTPCTLPSWACKAGNGISNGVIKYLLAQTCMNPHDTPESLSLPILQLFELPLPALGEVLFHCFSVRAVPEANETQIDLVTQVSTFFPYAFWQWMPIHTPSAKLVAPRVYGN